MRNSFRFVPLDEQLLDAAIALGASDLEDAIQVAAAIRIRANYIVTGNVADFRTSSVPAFTAAGFLAVLGTP